MLGKIQKKISYFNTPEKKSIIYLRKLGILVVVFHRRELLFLFFIKKYFRPSITQFFFFFFFFFFWWSKLLYVFECNKCFHVSFWELGFPFFEIPGMFFFFDGLIVKRKLSSLQKNFFFFSWSQNWRNQTPRKWRYSY